LWLSVALGLFGLVPLAMIKPAEAVAFGEEERAGGPFPLLFVGLMVIHVYLSHAGWATCQAFCNAYLDTGLNLSAASIGLMVGAGQFMATLAPLLTPRLARRYSNGWTLTVTTLAIGLSLIPLALIPHWTAAGVGLFGTVALGAVWMPALQVFQMELVERRWRSLAYGIVSMSMGLSFGTVSLAGGYIAAEWGYDSLFLLGIGLNMAGAALMWGILKLPAMRVLSAGLR
jgi:predicted MFS family arabinose efflux permease